MARQQSALPDFVASSSPTAITKNQIFTSPQSEYLTSPVQHHTVSPSNHGTATIGTGTGTGTVFPRSPLVHKGVDGLRRQEGLTSPLASAPTSGPGLGSRLRNTSVNSDLPDLPLHFTSANDHGSGSTAHSNAHSQSHLYSQSQSHGVRRKPSLSSQDLTSLRRDRQDLESAYRSGSPDGMVSQRATSHRGQRRFDSPIEMVDRSRPW